MIFNKACGAYFYKRVKRNRKLRFLLPTFASLFYAVAAGEALLLSFDLIEGKGI